MSAFDDFDRLRRDDLPELPRRVADALDDWLFRHHGVLSGSHNAGSFIDLLREEGLVIVPDDDAGSAA